MASPVLAGRSFSERLADFVEICEYRPINDDVSREAVFRLRYDAYVREGAISRNFSRRFTDDFDDMPNVWMIGLYVEGELASSIRIHIASPEHPQAPATSVFPDLLMPLVERGATLVDPTRFVTDHEMARRFPELPYATVRLAFLASERFAADYVLATVRTEHQAFYKRLFGFKALCEPRNYPSLAKPIVLMSINCEETRAGILQRNPFLISTPAECAAVFSRTPLVAPPLQPADTESVVLA